MLSEVVERVRPHGIDVTHDYQGKTSAIPLPATLSILLGNRLGGDTETTVRLYSDYPFPWRVSAGGANDELIPETSPALPCPAAAFSLIV